MSEIAGPRPKRILVLAMHPGYIRNYERTIRQLLDEGYDVHVAVANRTKQSADRVAERMANEYINLSVSRAPKTPAGNVDNLRRGLRALADYMRYQHPRFADANGLRDRAADKLLKRRVGLLPLVAITLYMPTLGRICHAGYADRGSAWALRLANLLPAPKRATRWLRDLAPDVLLSTPHVAIGASDPEFIDAARALGIPSGLLIASWDNLTNKGLIKSPTDLVVVWNDAQRDEAVGLHGVAADRVVVTGAQRFDDWFEISASTSRDEFVGRVGLDPGKPYLLYLCSSPFIAPDEVPFVRRLIEALRASDGPLVNAGLLIRPHPQNAQQWANVDVTEYRNAAVHPREGEQPVREASKQHFYDSMHHSLAVVGINTSALIEAGIVGRTVHTVLDSDFADAHEGTLHFKHLLVENGGLLNVAEDLDALVRNLESVERGDLRENHTEHFVASFIRPRGADRPASPIVADAIRELVEGPGRSRASVMRPSAAQRLLLLVLTALSIPTERRLLERALRTALKEVKRRVVARLGPRALLRRLATPDGAEPAVRRVREDEAPELVVIQPWRGDLAGEMLYWIPVVRRYCRSLARGTRVVVVTGDTDERWYATLDPENILHENSLPLTEWSEEGFVTLTRASGECTKIRFYGLQDITDRLSSGMRDDSLSWFAFAKATEIRALLTRRPAGGHPDVANWVHDRPSLLADLLGAAEAGKSLALALRTMSSGSRELLELDPSARTELTDAIEDAVAVISTDLGVAALAVSMCVATTLVQSPTAGPSGDVDILDRIASELEVPFEIVDPAALRVLTGAPAAAPG